MRKAKRSKPKKRNKFFKDNSQNESPEAEGLDAQKKTKEQREEKPIPVVPSQSVIPIKDIYRGMIITDDDRYIKIVEVLPTNFTLKSVEEQDNIIHLFASWLRIAPSNIQFKVITRRADSTNIIRNIMKAAEVEEQPKCRELTKDHIRFIQELSGQEALARRFFIIFEYENTGTRKKTIDDIADDIAEAVRKIRSGVGACGSEIVIPKDDDYFQAEALYQFYNRKSSAKESLAERVIRVTEDTMKVKGLTKGVTRIQLFQLSITLRLEAWTSLTRTLLSVMVSICHSSLSLAMVILQPLSVVGLQPSWKPVTASMWTLSPVSRIEVRLRTRWP